MQHGGQGHGGGVAAAAAQRGDVRPLVDALEAGGDDDIALVEGRADAVGGDRLDAGLGMRAVSDDADLRAGEADRLVAQRVDGHGHEGHAHLLARGEQHVHLASRGLVGDLPGQIDEHVGVVAHGADDDHDLVALLLGANGLAGGGQDFLAVGHARAAEFLHDDGHGQGAEINCSARGNR